MTQSKLVTIPKVSKTIRNCVFSYKCPKEWEDLSSNNDGKDTIRYCGECKKLVYFVTTEEELAYRIWERSCVAIPKEFGVKIFQKQILKSSSKPLLGAVRIKT
jgi:hypothetical protein